MATTRTFIAVDVSDTVRARTAELIRQLQACDVKVSWVAPPNMHVTLKFLGDLSDPQVAAVCQAAQRASREVASFAFRCHGAGAFPSPRQPRTVWIGVDEGTEQFTALHAALERQLQPLGIPRDRRGFCPHLTIGRVRSGGEGLRALGSLLAAEDQFMAGMADADELVVFASQLKRSGPEYEVLARAPLTG